MINILSCYSYQWRKVLDDHKAEHGGEDRVMMTESYSSLDIIKQYFGNSTHGGSHIPFNFQMQSRVSNSSSAQEYINSMNDFMKIVPSDYVANWVVNNYKYLKMSKICTRSPNSIFFKHRWEIMIVDESHHD